jgi:Mrp family chromosome partitioning ATPase
MTSTQLEQSTIDALAASDLSNLADSLTATGNDNLVQAAPATPVTRTRPASSQAVVRPECRPVAVGGMFAALHPECNQDYFERFQLLRSQLMLHHARRMPAVDVRTVAVMSTRRGEGKSFTATNLASVLAASSTQGVLLIDGNSEGPELPLGVDVLKGGLSQALAEPEKWAQSIHSVKESTLCVMPRGRAISRSLDFANLPRLFTALRRQFEWIILDGTSFATAPDAEWLASVADATILVTQGGSVNFDAFQETLMRIPPDNMVGVVFNQRPKPRESFRMRLKFSGKWKPFSPKAANA